MPYIFLGLAVLIAALILGRLLARVEAHFMASVFKGIAAAVLVGAGILSILMGRWPIVFVALVFAALLFMPQPKGKTISRSKKPMTVKEACEILDLEIGSLTAKNINESLSKNPILVTALNRVIGYSKAAAIAKKAYKDNKSIIDVAHEETGINKSELAKLLDPSKLTKGGISE